MDDISPSDTQCKDFVTRWIVGLDRVIEDTAKFVSTDILRTSPYANDNDGFYSEILAMRVVDYAVQFPLIDYISILLLETGYLELLFTPAQIDLEKIKRSIALARTIVTNTRCDGAGNLVSIRDPNGHRMRGGLARLEDEAELRKFPDWDRGFMSGARIAWELQRYTLCVPQKWLKKEAVSAVEVIKRLRRTSRRKEKGGGHNALWLKRAEALYDKNPTITRTKLTKLVLEEWPEGETSTVMRALKPLFSDPDSDLPDPFPDLPDPDPDQEE